MSAGFADERSISGRLSEALARIASIREVDGATVIDVPIMYPSGATAVIEIERSADRYWVSDMGRGHIECEMAGAQSFYAGIAKRVADDFGVGFDGNAMFALWVPSSRLEAAIVCVANASNRASSDAVRHAIEAKGRIQNDLVFERIRSIFGSRMVSRSAEILGRHAEWEAHNVVVFPDRHRAIFEYMSTHTNSISARFLMFTDIKSADRSVSLNAVVKDIASLDKKGQMIADVGNVIGINASVEQIEKYARAS